MKLYLYDPRTNVSTETSYEYLQGLTGRSKGSLYSAKTRGTKMRILNCYITEGVAPVSQRREWYVKEEYADEAWLPLPGTVNKYLISNYGRVKKINKSSVQYMLPYQRKGKGNLFVKIDRKEIKVGHLVAEVYLRKWGSKERVVRKNGIVTDDYVSNLEIITTKELGRRTGFKAKSMGVVKIDAESGEVLNEYRSAREAARNYFLSYQAILDRCNGVHGQSDGLIWKFSKDYKEMSVLKIS